MNFSANWFVKGLILQRILLFSVCFILLFVLSCGGDGVPGSSNDIRHHLKYRLQSLDPIESVDEASAIVLNVLHRRLYRLGAYGRIENDLVKSEVIKGHKVHLTLTPAVFTSGLPLTAFDVQYCFERLQKSGRQAWVLDGLEGLKASGRNALHLQLSSGGLVQRQWQSLKARMTLPKLSVYSAVEHKTSGEFVGASPFYLSENTPERIVLSSPQRQVFFTVMPDEAARYFFFRRDYFTFYEADGVFRLMPFDAQKYKAVDIDGMVVLYGAIVADGGLLDDVKFRLALNSAFDRQSYCEKSTLGSCLASEMPVPEGLGGRLDPIFNLHPMPVFQKPFDDYKVVIYTPPDRERQNLARIIRGILSKIDIPTDIQVLDLPTIIRFSNEKKGGIYLLKWLADYPHAENFLEPLFHSRNKGSGGNRSYYSNAQVDHLLDTVTYKPSELLVVQKLIRAQAPWLFVGHLRKRYYFERKADFRFEPGLTLWDWKTYAGTSNVGGRR